MQGDTSLTYKASDMILAVHLDVTYLSEPKAHSIVDGHSFLSSNEKFPHKNDVILNVAKIIWAVMSSTVEAKIGAIFINAKQALAMMATITEMGHPQPPTPIQINS